MLASRVGLLVGLIIGGHLAFPHSNAHQGEYAERGLEALVRRSTPVLAPSHSEQLPVTTRAGTFGAAKAPRRHLVSALDWSRVVKVHRCEQPASWHVRGTYSGGIGWLPATWAAWRAPWMPVRMDLATPQEQAWAMVRFVQGVLHYWPDQGWPVWCSGPY